MKLAEALNERAQLHIQLADIQNRINLNSTVQEGDTPAENPDDLIAQFDGLLTRLEELVKRINKTNANTSFNGGTLTDALAERDVLGQRQKFYTGIASTNAAGRYGYRALRSEIKMVSTIDVRTARQRADQFAQQYRELDAGIQATNWTVDLQ